MSKAISRKKFDELMLNGFKDLSISIETNIQSGVLDDFYLYLTELKKWNRKINLTSIKGDEETVKKHFLDSLTLLPFFEGTEKLLDIGSGGGLPAIPLKIMRPSLDVTCLESTLKKTVFLNQIGRKLDKKWQKSSFSVISERAENITSPILSPLLGEFDIISSRAFTNLKDFIEIALPYLAPNGKILAMKGPVDGKLKAELKEIEGLYTVTVHEIYEPFIDADRKVTIIELQAQRIAGDEL